MHLDSDREKISGKIKSFKIIFCGFFFEYMNFVLASSILVQTWVMFSGSQLSVDKLKKISSYTFGWWP